MNENDGKNSVSCKSNVGEKEPQLVYERFDVSVLHVMALHHFHRYLAVSPLCKGKDVLDIACGTGYGSAILAQSAHAVTGMDIDKATVEACRANYCLRHENLTFLHGDVAKMPLQDASVDVLVSFETIEHVDASKQKEFLREIRRVLRPGGMLVMSSPNKDTAHSNEFHVHELEEDEFRNLLQSQFKHSVFFRQKIVLSSFIRPYIGDDGARAELYGIMARDGRPIEPCEPDIDSKYVIALASDADIPALTPSVNLDASGAILDAFVRQNVMRSTSSLRTTIDEIRSRLREEAATRKSREESLRDGLAKHKARAEALRTTVDTCKATEARLRAALAEGKEREKDLRTSVSALQKRVVSFRPYSFSPEERRRLRRLAFLHPIRCRRLTAEMRLIASSPLFDAEYYCHNNPEAAKAPLLHFCQQGWQGGRNPSAHFDINNYLNNDQTCDPRENPLVHFLRRRHG